MVTPVVISLDYHAGQAEVSSHSARFKVLAAGRRWGKTRLGTSEALFVAVDDRLILWHVDLDNDVETLKYVGILHYEGYPVLRDIATLEGVFD